jgi:hypothetical protein
MTAFLAGAVSSMQTFPAMSTETAAAFQAVIGGFVPAFLRAWPGRRRS